MREQRVYLIATAKSTFCDSLLRSRSVVLDWYVAGGVRMARKPLIAGNWKCFKTIAEGRRLARELRNSAANVSDVDIMVAPPFTALAAVAEELSGSGIGLAAQNVHWEPPGAWTGEIAAEQLLDVGCQYAIIGHSERRPVLWRDIRDGQPSPAALPGNESHPHCVHRGNSGSAPGGAG